MSDRLEEAFLYAAKLHSDQKRKGADIPYISHLMAVAAIVLEHGGNEEEAIAALLHDTVEDQGGRTRLLEIRKRFGDKVASIVDGCTDSYAKTASEKEDWAKRKKEYLAHLPEADASTRLVSAADKLHNVRAILRDYRKEGEKLWERFKGGKDGTLSYYTSLVKIFRETGPQELAEELGRVVRELKHLMREANR
ncbi:HD domain-containing protein [Acidobacteria bacterium AH-259-O06]|nr:HD domain-containing protein [Acidobacteria bacterium AH-259-O06]